jgi:hypothetical protein
MGKLTAVLVGCVLAITGCVSMPSSGPVRAYNVTQGISGGEEQYLQVNAVGPSNGWGPQQVVQGFLAANASFAQNHQIAREYLAGPESAGWNPGWSAKVFSDDGPDVALTGVSARTAEVTISGEVQANVGETGAYAAYAVPQAANASQSIVIDLVKTDGQWRISKPPSMLLLSAVDFAADYQSRNLYFFNPGWTWLVADPVYVPLEAGRADPTNLLLGLVRDLISQPQDWLSNDATTTAFPPRTKVSQVTLAGETAAVYLTGPVATAKEAVLQQITAQLLWTLGGSGNSPAVTSVELFLDGKVWTPLGAGNVPVQQQSSYSKYAPPSGAGSGTFYYLDSQGDVLQRSGPNGQPAKVYTASAKGPKFSDIAVSPDGKYLAGTSGGWVYTAAIGGQPQRRVQGTFTSLSWDYKDQLWIAGTDGVEVVQGSTATPVTVMSCDTNRVTASVTALRVAPDGVRVAMIVGGSELSFGAIVASQAGVTICESPFSVNGSDLTGLTWYGAGDVIALSGTGGESAAVEYPVNGGTPTRIPSAANMVNITASAGNPLIGSFANGEISYNESVNGAWISLNGAGQSAVYPG